MKANTKVVHPHLGEGVVKGEGKGGTLLVDFKVLGETVEVVAGALKKMEKPNDTSINKQEVFEDDNLPVSEKDDKGWYLCDYKIPVPVGDLRVTGVKVNLTKNPKVNMAMVTLLFNEAITLDIFSVMKNKEGALFVSSATLSRGQWQKKLYAKDEVWGTIGGIIMQAYGLAVKERDGSQL